MGVVAAYMLLLLGGGGFVPVGTDMDGLAMQMFGLPRAVVDDVLYVAEATWTDPIVLADLVRRESDGSYDVVRYCVKWKNGVSKGKKAHCDKATDCRKGCVKNKRVWRNRLALGVWQLWDAPTSSWIRWYSEHVRKIGPECAMDRKCAREVMISVVQYLKSVKPRECGAESLCSWDNAWISRWNGCGFCERVVGSAMNLRVLLSAALGEVQPDAPIEVFGAE